MVGSEESGGGGGGGEGRGEQAVGNIHHQLGHIALTQVHMHVCCSRQLQAIELLESFFCSHGCGGGVVVVAAVGESGGAVLMAEDLTTSLGYPSHLQRSQDAIQYNTTLELAIFPLLDLLLLLG